VDLFDACPPRACAADADADADADAGRFVVVVVVVSSRDDEECSDAPLVAYIVLVLVLVYVLVVLICAYEGVHFVQLEIRIEFAYKFLHASSVNAFRLGLAEAVESIAETTFKFIFECKVFVVRVLALIRRSNGFVLLDLFSLPLHFLEVVVSRIDLSSWTYTYSHFIFSKSLFLE
jgi:hypothetical protein